MCCVLYAVYMISIIIPVYNQAKKLDKCLKTLTKQTYSNYEIIIVDDGSTDDLESVLEKYAPIFRLKMEVIHQENAGSNAARNRGKKKARGEFLLFCDADIEMHPNMLKTMKCTLDSEPRVSYCYSSHKFGKKVFRLWPFDAGKLKKMPYIHTTSLIRTEHFPKSGWDENIKRFQDWDLWLTMNEEGHIGFWIDDILFKVNTGGTMSKWMPSFMYKLLPFLPSVRSYKKSERIILEKHGIL